MLMALISLEILLKVSEKGSGCRWRTALSVVRHLHPLPFSDTLRRISREIRAMSMYPTEQLFTHCSYPSGLLLAKVPYWPRRAVVHVGVHLPMPHRALNRLHSYLCSHQSWGQYLRQS